VYPTQDTAYTRHRPIIHQTCLYHTPDGAVSYTRHRCIISQTLLYHTPDTAVSYQRRPCIIHQIHVVLPAEFSREKATMGHSDFGSLQLSALRIIEGGWCIIHRTPNALYHAPNFTVSYTKHHCIVHQTSLYRTPYLCTKHYNTVMTSVSPNHVWCVIQSCLVYDGNRSSSVLCKLCLLSCGRGDRVAEESVCKLHPPRKEHTFLEWAMCTAVWYSHVLYEVYSVWYSHVLDEV